MNNITERIKKISNFFIEMQVTNVEGENVIYVVVKFPLKWIIDEAYNESVGVSVINGNNSGEYYFCTSIETGFDAIFDAIDNNIEKMKEAEERTKLLIEKRNELEDLFEDETISLDTLKTIEFTFRQKKDKNGKKNKEINNETTEEENKNV